MFSMKKYQISGINFIEYKKINFNNKNNKLNLAVFKIKYILSINIAHLTCKVVQGIS